MRGRQKPINIRASLSDVACQDLRVVVSGAADAPVEAAALEIADSTDETAVEPVAEASTEVVAVSWAAEPETDSVPEEAAVDEAALSVPAADVVVSCRLMRCRGEAKAAEAPRARMAEDLKSMIVVGYLDGMKDIKQV